jgi:ferredoxin
MFLGDNMSFEETVTRKIIEIDEDKCTGCGQCVVNCPEGALEIIEGKARVVNEHFCDGLGACIGECPEGALQIVERAAPVFDEAAVLEHSTQRKAAILKALPKLRVESATVDPCHCPSARLLEWESPSETVSNEGRASSAIRQWPLKLRLLPPTAPFFLEAKKLVVISDCAGLADPNTHADFLKNAALVQVCPKFENPNDNIDKLASIFQTASALESVEVVEMTVPCCRSLLPEVKEALKLSGTDVPVVEHVIDQRGEEVSC